MHILGLGYLLGTVSSPAAETSGPGSSSWQRNQSAKENKNDCNF